jgi:hypothetical protein
MPLFYCVSIYMYLTIDWLYMNIDSMLEHTHAHTCDDWITIISSEEG